MHAVIIIFQLHPNILHLCHNTPKHKEFLDSTQFMFNVAIDYHNFTQTPYDQFMEDIKDKLVESIGDHDLFQFLGKANSP